MLTTPGGAADFGSGWLNRSRQPPLGRSYSVRAPLSEGLPTRRPSAFVKSARVSLAS
jgi:hypothetical protein